MGRPIQAQAYNHEVQRRGLLSLLPPRESIYSLRPPARRLRLVVTSVICLRGRGAMLCGAPLAAWLHRPWSLPLLSGGTRRPAQIPGLVAWRRTDSYALLRPPPSIGHLFPSVSQGVSSFDRERDGHCYGGTDNRCVFTGSGAL